MAASHTTEQLREWLMSAKGAERTRAAKAIARQNCAELGPELFTALQTEMKNPAAWDRQCEMLRALGILSYKPGRGYFAALMSQTDTLGGLVRMRATQAYILAAATPSESLACLLGLLENGDLLTMNACTELLDEGHVLPEPAEIPLLLETLTGRADTIDRELVRGVLDPREYMLRGILLWKKQKRLDGQDGEALRRFLAHCREYSHLAARCESFTWVA